jgi:transcriptional regulator with XRE-family HTH domain
MDRQLGELVRSARLARGWSQRKLGEELHYSASRVSRLELGVQPLADMQTLQLLSAVLGIAPVALGIAATVTSESRALEDDPVRRRQLLAHVAVSAAAAAVPGTPAAARGPVNPGDLLVGRLRDAALGWGPPPKDSSPDMLRAALSASVRDFDGCRYTRLADDLPQLLATGHAHAVDQDPQSSALLAEIYTLATRMLIKLDDQQLGWLYTDRAKALARAGDAPLVAGEAARNLAILARKAGWHEQASGIVLAAADHPSLKGDDPHLIAERGLLVMSAAYTAARDGDKAGMRELTDQAEAMAASLGGGVLLLVSRATFAGTIPARGWSMVRFVLRLTSCKSRRPRARGDGPRVRTTL